jgi:Antibiotic biosynthesis monooxygenase
VGLVALHDPHPEYRKEMIPRVHRAAEIMATPGCLAVDCWVSDDHQAVVSTSQWRSGTGTEGRDRGRADGRR